jgi:malate dehydrogenase (oxaloacetate-decarboxylating)(NADP+)
MAAIAEAPHNMAQGAKNSPIVPPVWAAQRWPIEERVKHGNDGRLAPTVQSFKLQRELVELQLSMCTTPLQKWALLNRLRPRDVHLFYSVVLNNLLQLVPVIYTPTIGAACLDWSRYYETPQGFYLSHQNHAGRVAQTLENWPNEVDIIVVSDGGRILGLGDLGANGMGIPIGKLDLYITGAGFDPTRTLPVLIDTGTNTQRLLEDKFYIGQRTPRINEDDYYNFLDEFVQAAVKKWPNVLVQFEDFANEHAFGLLNKYREKVRCFNDDIQGTGAVILAGLINAITVTKIEPRDLRIVFLGAGSAGIGVAQQIMRMLVTRGLTPEEARATIWLVDSKGLISSIRTDLNEEKKPWARLDISTPLTTLQDVVAHVKPNVLIGLAAQPNAFSEQVLRTMSATCPTPIVFALSNPTTKSECSLQQAIEFTNGTAVFASGSPFDPIQYNGKTYLGGQGNNMYIFPGLGLGTSFVKSRHVTDGMLQAAAQAVADACLKYAGVLDADHIYPPIDRIRDISADVAYAAATQAFAEGLTSLTSLPTDLRDQIRNAMYNPEL